MKKNFNILMKSIIKLEIFNTIAIKKSMRKINIKECVNDSMIDEICKLQV